MPANLAPAEVSTEVAAIRLGMLQERMGAFGRSAARAEDGAADDSGGAS